MPKKFTEEELDSKLYNIRTYVGGHLNQLSKKQLIDLIKDLKAVNDDFKEHDSNVKWKLREKFHHAYEAIWENADGSVISRAEAQEAIDNVLNDGMDIEKAIDQGIKNYQKEVPEEDRYTRNPNIKSYSQSRVGKFNIKKEIKRQITELQEMKESSKESLGSITIGEYISRYHDMEIANSRRGTFSKLWTSFKSIFGRPTEEQMIEKFKETIIDVSGFDKKLMEKAFNTHTSDHTANILNVAQEKYYKELNDNYYKEQEKDTRESEIISDDVFKENIIENNKDITKEDELEFSIEFSKNNDEASLG